ncbi:MAG: hypothetical protein HC915_12720 [Anaerolineae bacterium]|nr:hypothetical protein [Anaerolineae bacterium]
MGALPPLQRSTANPPALPPLPDPAIIQQVLDETNGAQFIPMGAPLSATSRLADFHGPFENVDSLTFDFGDVANYLTQRGTLKETVIPLLNSANAVFAPNMTAPGDEPRPGQIVGAVFHPYSDRMMVVVVVWKEEAPMGCTDCDVDKIRFYYNSTEYEEFSVYLSLFNDANGDGLADPIDGGAVIAHQVSCVTVGLTQVCWKPDDFEKDELRDQEVPKGIIYSAYSIFKDRFDLLGADFYVDDAVPDLLGKSAREACMQALYTATRYHNLNACRATAVISAQKGGAQPGAPIAILSVQRDADIRAYTAEGSYVGSLPRGDYLVLDATPNATTPGEPAVLFLVNAHPNRPNYLIPSVVMQGFGQSSAYDSRQAGIKDGFAHYRGVAW